MNFNYSVTVPVSASIDGEQTNYVLRLRIIKGFGVNIAGTIYLNNHSKNWPYDIQFCNDDGTVLDFWREQYTDEMMVIWVECDYINATGNTNFYLYYGSGVQAESSDGDGTFVFFDDFESGSIASWDPLNGPAIESTIVKDGNYSMRFYDNTTSAQSYVHQDISPVDMIAVGIHIYPKVITTAYFSIIMKSDSTEVFRAVINTTGVVQYYYSGAWRNFSIGGSVVKDKWYYFRFEFFTTDNLIKLYIDNEYCGTGVRCASGSTINNITIASASTNGTGIACYLDNFNTSYITKNPPSWASPGAEAAHTGVLLFPNRLSGTDDLSFL